MSGEFFAVVLHICTSAIFWNRRKQWPRLGHQNGEHLMTKVFVAIVAVLMGVAALSGCTTYGKGKAPPAVVTNG
jgi:hypothetical protein